MSNAVEQRGAVLERLLSSLVHTPKDLNVKVGFLPGRVNVTAQTSANETGLLIGANGVHFKALQLVVEMMGRSLDQHWVFKVADPEDERRGPQIKAETPEDHDTSDDTLLLMDLLEGCGVEAVVLTRGGIAGGFDFEISPVAQKDVAALLDPFESIEPPKQRQKESLNLLGAIRTIFNAIGKSSGVQYRVSTV